MSSFRPSPCSLYAAPRHMRYRPMKLTSCTTQHTLSQQKAPRIERDTAIDVNCCWSNGCIFGGCRRFRRHTAALRRPFLTGYVTPRYNPDICMHASTRRLSGAIVRCLGWPTALMVIVSNSAEDNFSPFCPFRFRFAAGGAGRTPASNRISISISIRAQKLLRPTLSPRATFSGNAGKIVFPTPVF